MEEELGSQKLGILDAMTRYIYETEEAGDLREAATRAIARRLKDRISVMKFGPLLQDIPNLPMEVLEAVSRTTFNPRSVFSPD